MRGEVSNTPSVPKNCTCGYPSWNGNDAVRFHTYDCLLRTGMNVGQALELVSHEVDKARRKFPPFNSPHEGYAVIAEELEELWAHAKANTGRTDEAMDEAVQIAAMAIRYITDLSELSGG